MPYVEDYVWELPDQHSRIVAKFFRVKVFVLIEFETMAGGFCEKRILLDTGASVSVIPAEWVRAPTLDDNQRILVRQRDRWGYVPHQWAGERVTDPRHRRLEEIAAIRCRFRQRDGLPTKDFFLPFLLVADSINVPIPVLGMLGLSAAENIPFRDSGGKQMKECDAHIGRVQLGRYYCDGIAVPWRIDGGSLVISRVGAVR